MPKTVCQSVAWFKRYKTLKSVTVGRVAQLEKIFIFSGVELAPQPNVAGLMRAPNFYVLNGGFHCSSMRSRV